MKYNLNKTLILIVLFFAYGVSSYGQCNSMPTVVNSTPYRACDAYAEAKDGIINNFFITDAFYHKYGSVVFTLDIEQSSVLGYSDSGHTNDLVDNMGNRASPNFSRFQNTDINGNAIDKIYVTYKRKNCLTRVSDIINIRIRAVEFLGIDTPNGSDIPLYVCIPGGTTVNDQDDTRTLFDGHLVGGNSGLEATGNIVTYNGLTFPHTLNYGDQMSFRVENSSGCINTSSAVVRKYVVTDPSSISAQAPALSECDLDNDGYVDFDLTTTKVKIYGSGATYRYYPTASDRLLGTNEITGASLRAYRNRSQNTDDTLYRVVQFPGGATCTLNQDIDLKIGPPVNNLVRVTYEECLTGTNTRAEFFLDGNQETKVLKNTGNTSDYDISFHESSNDAYANTNPITTSPYQSISKVIYIRVKHKTRNECPLIKEFELTALPRPSLKSGESIDDMSECATTAGGMTANFDMVAKKTAITAKLKSGSRLVSIYNKADATQNDISTQSAYNTVSGTMVAVIGLSSGICSNLDIEFNVIVQDKPTVSNQILETCSSGSGTTENFDLTSKETNVLGITNLAGYTFEYYENNVMTTGLQNKITTPTVYSASNNTVVYVKVTKNNTSCFSVAELTLKIKTLLALKEVTYTSCESGTIIGTSMFNLSSRKNEILNGATPPSDYTVTYYEQIADANAGNTNRISTNNYRSAPKTIYARAQKKTGGCPSVKKYNLDIELNPVQSTVITDITECIMMGTNTDFDLSAKKTDIQSTLTSGENVKNIYLSTDVTKQDKSTTVSYNTSGATMTAVIESSSRICTTDINFDLIVNKGPSVAIASIDSCENPPNSFRADFDLASVRQTVIGASKVIADYNFKYYDSDVNARTNTTTGQISSPYNSASRSVYMRVAKKTGNTCPSLAEIIINVKDLPKNLNTVSYNICGTTGQIDTQFDLSSKKADILPTGATVADYTVTYYVQQLDADAGNSNSIATPTSYTSATNTIYASVEKISDQCPVVQSFNLVFTPLPGDGIAVLDITNCENPIGSNKANFDLSGKKATINGKLSGGDVVSSIYQSGDSSKTDLSGNTVHDSTSTSMIALVKDSGNKCENNISFDLVVSKGPLVANTSIDSCEDAPNSFLANFDLAGARQTVIGAGNAIADYNFKYYDSNTNARTNTTTGQISSPYRSGTRFVYMRVAKKTGNTCSSLAEIALNVKDLPKNLNTVSYDICGTTGQIDTQFDLSSKKADILPTGATVVDYTVTYYVQQLDADAGNSNSIATPASYTSATNTIYASVEKISDQCPVVQSFNLVFTPLPGDGIAVLDITNCENPIGSNKANFDLSGKKATINGKLSGGDVVSSIYQSGDSSKTDLSGNTVYDSTSTSMIALVKDSGNKCENNISFDLVVSKGPLVANTSIDSCEDAPNSFLANFDLAGARQTVIGAGNAIADYNFKYYDSNTNARTNTTTGQISSPYRSGTRFVYMRVAKKTGNTCSSLAEIALNVKDLPKNLNTVSYDICGTTGQIDTQFDLSSKKADILPTGATAADYTVTYYVQQSDADAGNSNSIAMPTSYTSATNTIYASVEKISDQCPIVQPFNLVFTPLPGDTKSITSIEKCETTVGGGSAQFDLPAKKIDIETNVLTVVGEKVKSIYKTSDASQIDVSANSSYQLTSGTTSMTALITDANDKCTNKIIFDLTVNPPVPTLVTITACQNTATVQEADFDLTSQNLALIGGAPANPSNYNFKYYDTRNNASNGTITGQLTSPYRAMNGTNVYARISHKTNTSCPFVATLTLNTKSLPLTQNATYDNCATTATATTATFVLSTKNTDILPTGASASNYTVAYYDTQAKADSGVAGTSLSNSYMTNTQKIYARVMENTSQCPAVSELQLTVIPLPGGGKSIANLPQCSTGQNGSGADQAQFDISQKVSDIETMVLNNAEKVKSVYSLNDGSKTERSTNSNYVSLSDRMVAVIEDATGTCTNDLNFDLIVETKPDVNNNITVEACANPATGNMADFDLDSQKPKIVKNITTTNPISDYTITYHVQSSEANTGTNPITTSMSYSTMDTDVYARIIKNSNKSTGCEITSKLTLDVDTIILTSPSDMESCEVSGNPEVTYDLLSQRNNINTTDVIKFYESDPTMNTSPLEIVAINNYKVRLPSGYTTGSTIKTIYYKVENAGKCSITGSFALKAVGIPAKGLSIANFEQCEGLNNNQITTTGIANFSLVAKATLIENDLNASYPNTEVESIYVKTDPTKSDVKGDSSYGPVRTGSNVSMITKIRNKTNNRCVNEIEFSLIVRERELVKNNIIYPECEGTTANEATFDLTSRQLEILKNPTTVNMANYDFTYYTANNIKEVAAGTATAITNPTNLPSQSKTVYFQVINKTKALQCPTFGVIELRVESNPVTNYIPQDTYACGLTANPQNFDLMTHQSSEKIRTLATENLTFHKTLANAELNVLDISNESAYSGMDQTVIFARLENNGNKCYTTSSFKLVVEQIDIPRIEAINPILESCDDNQDGFATFNLTEIENTIAEPIAKYEYYRTKPDAQSKTNEISNPYQYFNKIPNTEDVYARVKVRNSCYAYVKTTLNTKTVDFNPPTDYVVCQDPIDKYVLYDLTTKESEIRKNTNHTVKFYKDYNDAVNNVSSYTNVGSYKVNVPTTTFDENTRIETIYYRLEDAKGCSRVGFFYLKIYPTQPIFNITNLEKCEDIMTNNMASFNIYNKAKSIRALLIKSDKLSKIYNTADKNKDLSGEQDYKTTGSTLYAEIENSIYGCKRNIDFKLIVNLAPTLSNNNIKYNLCSTSSSSSTVDFDLDSRRLELLGATQAADTKYELTYFKTQSDADNNKNQIAQTSTYNSNSTRLYVRAIDNTQMAGCVARATVDLEVNPIPASYAISDYEICGTGLTSAEFNLKSYRELIIKEKKINLTNYTFTLHSSLSGAQNKNSDVSSNRTYKSSGEVIHTRLEDKVTGCYTLSSFNLALKIAGQVINFPSKYWSCSNRGSGTPYFYDLTTKEIEMVSNPSDYIITYYRSFADATASQNAVSNPSTYTTVKTQEKIFAKLKAKAVGSTCEQIIDFEIEFAEKPRASASIYECKSNSTNAIFDLTSLAKNISQDPKNIISYHSTLKSVNSGGSEILRPTRYDSKNNILFAKIEDPRTRCYSSVNIELKVITEAPSRKRIVIDSQCEQQNIDDQALFDLNAVASKMTSTVGAAVSFYDNRLDAFDERSPIPKTNIQTDNRYMIGRTNYSKNCYTLDSIRLNVIPKPLKNNQIGDIANCSGVNNQAVFDLADYYKNELFLMKNRNDYNVTIHENQSDSQSNINDKKTESRYKSASRTLYFRVEHKTLNCLYNYSFDLNVQQSPAVTPPLDLEQCEDINQRATAIFDLSPNRRIMLGINLPSSQYDITYYTSEQNAKAETNPISRTEETNYRAQRTSNNSIYTKTTNLSTKCTIIKEFKYKIKTLPPINRPVLIAFCDTKNTNQAVFDLDARKPDILNGLSRSKYPISYFDTESDANLGAPKLSNTTNYTLTTASKRIFFKMRNSDNGCDIIAPIDLSLGSKPILNANNDIYGCIDNIGDVATFNLQDYSERISPSFRKEKFEYYNTQQDADKQQNRISDIQTISARKDIFLRIINRADEKCFAVDAIKLDVVTKPTKSAKATDILEQCDDDKYWSTRGIVEFDLLNKSSEIKGAAYISSPIHRVVYYSGKNTQGDLTGKLATKYVNQTNPDKLYAELENTDTGCISEIAFDIKVVGPILKNNIKLSTCSTNNNGKSIFNLNDSKILLSDKYVNETFVFYDTKAHALSGGTTGQITNPSAYTNVKINGETIYVRVTQTSGSTACANIAPLRLIVSSKPNNNRLTDVNICTMDLDATNHYNLLNKEGEILGTQKPQNYTVSFYKTSQDQTNDVNKLNTNYILAAPVTDMYIRVTNNTTGCYTTDTYKINKIDNGKLVDIDRMIPIIKQSCNSEFDLSSYKEKETGITVANLSVGYYVSFTDAITDRNKIIHTSDYTASRKNIYKRIFDKSVGCPHFQKYNLQSQESLAPDLLPTVLEECDNDLNKDEFTQFDLTKSQTRLSSNSALFTFKYFNNEMDAKNGNNEILNINTYINKIKTREKLYVHAENASIGCDQISNFYVQVSRVPDINRTAVGIATCSTNEDQLKYGVGTKEFLLSNASKEIIGTKEKESDFEVNFYTTDVASKNEDASLQIRNSYVNKRKPRDETYSNVLYKTTGCYEYIPVTLTVYDTPTLVQNYELKICSDTSTYQFDTNRDFDPVFNDNSANETVTYYSMENDANSGINPITQFTNMSLQETKFVRAVNNTSNCSITEPFVLKVNAKPSMIKGVTLVQCDDAIVDGKSKFNLKNGDNQVQTNQQNKVSYYLTNLDAQRGLNRLSDIYTNSTNNQQIYATSTNAAGCSSIVPMMLYVKESVLTLSDRLILESCDDLSVDGSDTNGITRFDLSQSEATYRKRLSDLGNTLNYQIDFYDTEEESIIEINAKQNKTNYLNITPSLETLYVRIIEPNTKKCISNKEILHLLVNPLPKYDPTISSNIFCSEGRENPLLGIDLGKEIDYQWSTGETTSTISPTKEGMYNVKYTNRRTQCTYTSRPITFELSSSPKNVKVNVETFRTSGKITVTAEGDGIASYVYKLDEMIQFLDNPVIDNVGIGKHILTIKDVNGCGSVLKEVLIPGYIDFMTPNNDGINDTWTLGGLEDTKNPIIRIYDRYNTLLAEFNPVTNTWDGNFKTQKMPSDDYWFKAIYTGVDTNREDTIVGHFTLKR